MSFNASYKIESTNRTAENCHVRIIRIFGGKDEGWNAWVAVFEKKTDQTPLASFPVHVNYADGMNPYPALYDEAKKDYRLFDVKTDEVAVVQEQEVVVKKAKSKKNSA